MAAFRGGFFSPVHGAANGKRPRFGERAGRHHGGMNPAAILLRATYAQDLTRLLVELSTLTGPLATVKRVTLAGRICEVLAKLGATAQGAAPVVPPPPPLPDADDPNDDPAQAYEPVGEARGARAALYSFDPNRKPAQRRRENAAAVALLKKIQSGEIAPDAVTEEHRAVLAKYSGNGGNLTDEDGKKGSPFEYYTPLPVAEGTWQLLREMGFSGGRVLDPSAGTGIFGASAPKDSVVDAIELSGASGAINQIVNGGPGYKCRTASFEEIAAREDDDTYDAVITNVPFGDASTRGASKLKDPRYQDESLEGYFILTGLRKLKPGGFAAFIVPERVVSGRDGAESRVRMAASRMAEFRGAYRLPSTLFVTAGAEVITDIIVFQKHSAGTREKVRELVAEGRQDVLKKANVLWEEFLDGRYFAGEGRKFVMGEFIPKNPEKFRDVNRVKSDKSPADVARLLTKFGPSRIDFAELDAVETLPITYSDGDTMQHDGLTLQLRAGEWVPIRSDAPKFDAKRPETFGAYPMNAFDAGLTWEEVDSFVSTLRKTGRSEQIPYWMHALWVEIQRVSPDSRAAAWGAVLVGAAAEAAFAFHQQQEIGFDYTREYPKLTAAMEATAADARAVTVGGAARSALQFARTHYSKRRGFDSAWRGDVASGQADNRGSAELFSAARYRLGSVFVPMEEARAIYGEDFDPMHDNEWCISPDGASVARADDVFVGNVGDVVGGLRKAAAATASDDIRDKLVSQIAEAHSRADRIDVSKVEFNLFSPLATMEQKAEFLRRYYDEGFVVGFSDAGEKEIIYSRSDSASDTVDQAKKKKLYRRMSWYLKHGTVTMGSAQAGDRKAALAELRKMTEEASEKFNLWARSNDTIMGALEAQANDVNRLVFRKVKDTTAVPLPGWKLAAPPNGMIPHAYQYSFIRQQGRQFGGINGYAVGLGKTSTALAATLYVQSIGVKKKTVFAVPNSVLSNWYKESLRCYDEATMARCLFVGMTVTEDGSPTVKSSDYDRDLNRIAENRHDKIFMTFEALGRLKMQEGTISDYIAYVSRHDASMAEAERKADDIKAEGKRAGLAAVLTDGKPGGAPFIETLGIDSLVLDEAHVAKNSSSGGGFKQARFLSLAKTSGTGDWMQAVAWYIRGRSEKADGVLCLTATPITNSPLEIHAMLSLATGRDKVNDLMMGASGAEKFLEMICDVEMEDDESIDGIMRQTRVFRGLRNVDVLRRALGSVATIETPETVGMTIKLPDEEQSHTAVEMPAEMVKRLQEYKGAFRWAIDSLSGKDDNRGDEAAYNRVQAKFGEPMALIGHPFNMVRKMARLIVDPDLDEGGTVFYPGDDEIARKAVEQFNKLKLTEERPRPGPLTAEDDVKTGKVKQGNADDDPEVKTYKITVRAKMDITAGGRSRVVIDTMDGATQAKFEAIADKLKLELDVSVPPKLAALVENVSQERAMPRGVGGIVKQLIFCDELGMHRKIVRLLAKRCGVPASKIAIITGQTNNRPEEIIDVQNGFNAHGPDNRYEVIVANEKAEVGINLQQGTQAIHHLTIGWTPDSLTQRNGRGVRQGNVAEYVRVYSYDAVGTFDVAKRAMVNRKADWIGNVMDTNGGSRVAVTGGLTREQEIALIDSVGDPGAIERHMAKQAEAEKKQRADSNRQRQQVGLDTILSNRQFLEQNKDPSIFATRLLLDARVADDVLQKLVKRRTKAREDGKPTDKIDVAIGNARTAALKAADAAKESFDAMDDAALRRAFATMDDAVQKGERLGSEHAARVVQWGRAKLKDQCQARDDWAAQVDQAKAILAEAIKSFAGRAGEDGAMPAFIAQSFADGEGDMHEGKVIVKGSLLSGAGSSGGFGVVVDAKSAMQMTEWGWNTYSLDIMIKDETAVTLPGDPGFHALAAKIAAAEDKLLSEKPIAEGQKTIANHSPEVAALRKVAALQDVPARMYLPMPCLPKPILKDAADRSGAGRHFWRLQMQYLTAFGANSGRFAFDPSKVTLSTVLDAGQSTHGKSVRIAEMARSLGDRVTPDALQVIGMTFDSSVLAAVGLTMDGFMDAIRAADDIPEAGGRHIIEKLEFFEFPGNSAAFQWIGRVNWAFSAAADGFERERKREARRLADIAAQEAAAVAAGAVLPAGAPVAETAAVEPDAPTAVAVTPADTSNGLDITGMADSAAIGVRGNTQRWFKLIKASQERHGGYARYIAEGRGGPQWNIKVGGWKILARDNPEAAKDLILCKAI
ncbi:MAG: hypothetical protein RLZZ373_3178 [Pseudomonadota bacterium]|jgi:predicted RNA methylase